MGLWSSSKSKSETTTIAPTMPVSATEGIAIAAFESPLQGGSLVDVRTEGDILQASLGGMIQSTHNESFMQSISPTTAINIGSAGASASGAQVSSGGTGSQSFDLKTIGIVAAVAVIVLIIWRKFA